MKSAFSIVFATTALATFTHAALTPITVTGNAFYNGTERFYIRGVDYQPGSGTTGESDPLVDASTCKRDIPYFQKLGINTIRVYDVNNSPSANHDACMSALEDAGIYLILDTDNALYSLNRNSPAESYNSVYLQDVFATIDTFAAYNNTMAFIAGNEVINNDANTDAAPYVKAVIRDMKEYIADRGLRTIPVGYAAADVDANLEALGDYLNCGSDDLARTDFYAVNDYSWCDPSSFTTSGYNTLVQNFTGYGRPIFFSEFGCITNDRTFQEVSTIYSSEMTGVFSGGLVYEYSSEGNGYGLVTISGNTVTEESNFQDLVNQYASATNPSGSGGATTASGATTCPTMDASWNVSGSAIPATPSEAVSYFKNGAGSGPGLAGAGSQESGDSDNESAGTASAGADSTTAYATGGTATGTASSSSSTSTKKSAAVSIKASEGQFMGLIMMVVLASTMGGAALLL